MSNTAAETPFHIILKSIAQTALQPLAGTPEDYVIATRYAVQGLFDSLEQPQELGIVEAQYVNLVAACNNGIPSLDVMDSVSGDLSDVHGIIYEGTADISENFEDVMGMVESGNLLYIPTDEVLAESWGPTAILTLADHSNCALVVVGVSDLVQNQDATTRAAAIERGVRLGQMGFTRYAETPFFFLNTAFIRPELPVELQLAPESEALAA